MNLDQLEVRTALYDQKMNVINQRIELLQEKEDLLIQKQKANVKDKDSNKNWPFSSYEFCFIARALKYTNLLLPTVLIRLECNGATFGPFRALLDTGAQPNLISYTLFKRLRCIAEQAKRRVLGVASQSFAINRKMQACIKPWFDSPVGLNEALHILPHENTWKPLLPSKELQVQEKDKEFRQALADPEYFSPKEVHILLGIRFVAKILDYRIGYEVDGTALYSTPLGNVIMGEQFEEEDSNVENVAAIMDDSMEEKLCKMIEKLWKQDEIELDSKSVWTQEEQAVEDYFEKTHYRDRDGRFVVKIPFKANIDSIGSSRAVAIRRFYSVERKL